jgi:hypothetical protein
MATLIWRAPLQFRSNCDEAAFFQWLQAIPGVLECRGIGRELHVKLRSSRPSATALREFIAIYQRYGGELAELAQFASSTNQLWFKDPGATWYAATFGGGHAA